MHLYNKKNIKERAFGQAVKSSGDYKKIECFKFLSKYLSGVDYGERDFRKSFNKSS